jgi:hypothetical protein
MNALSNVILLSQDATFQNGKYMLSLSPLLSQTAVCFFAIQFFSFPNSFSPNAPQEAHCTKTIRQYRYPLYNSFLPNSKNFI